MLKLNKSTRFGLYSLVTLAERPDELVSASQIAQRFRISEHHLAKVLQQLVKARLVRSTRGTKGGFQLAKNPAKVTLLDVVRVFEPDLATQTCALLDHDELCAMTGACRVGAVLGDLQRHVTERFAEVTIESLVTPRLPSAR